MDPVITSLADNDMYQFTMQQALLHHFPGSEGVMRFDARMPFSMRSCMLQILPQFKEEVKHLCSLRFTKDELDYMRSIRFFQRDYIEFLRLFQFNEDFIEWPEDDRYGFTFEIRGPLSHILPFETPLLAIVSELWCRLVDERTRQEWQSCSTKGLRSMIDTMRKARSRNRAKKFPYQVAEFGTRRRYSKAWHEKVVEEVVDSKLWADDGQGVLVGTSNMDLARRRNIRPFGTMSHAWLMAGQGCGVQIQKSQIHMLEVWAREYRGDLGIALTDTIGMDAFCRDFDLYLAKLYDGLRHDSGEERWWYEKFIELYKGLRIDPRTKLAVFSNSITPDASELIYDYIDDRSPSMFAMGGALTNSCGLPKELHPRIVVKLVEFEGKPVAKISDDPGKGMCRDQNYLDYLRKVFMAGQNTMTAETKD